MYLKFELVRAVVIGENDQSFLKSDLNCLYSGVISGSQGGYAALSTCDTNEGFVINQFL